MSDFNWYEFYKDKIGESWYYGEITVRQPEIKAVSEFKSVLGVGSGRCIVEDYLSKVMFAVASDLSRKLLVAAKSRHGNLQHYVCCDAFYLPFRDKAFDCVYSQGFMEHFDDAEVVLIVDEMVRVGETVLFFIPLPAYRNPSLGVEHRRTLDAWTKLLSMYPKVDTGCYEEPMGPIGGVTVKG